MSAGNADYGVVPIENSTEGVVTHTLDLLQDADVQICGEGQRRHRALPAFPVGPAEGRSAHPFPLPRTGAVPPVDRRPTTPAPRWRRVSSTAQAAKEARSDREAAAVSSRLAGDVYGLKIIQGNIADNHDNITRFFVIGGDPPSATGQDKTSIAFAVKDRVGVLHEMLGALREKQHQPHQDRVASVAPEGVGVRFLHRFQGAPAGAADKARAGPARRELRLPEGPRILSLQPMSIIDKVPDHIRGIVPYVPGKPIDEVEREYGIQGSAKLASNENSLGPSPKAVAALRERLEELHLYPDGGCFHLRNALASRLGVEPERLIFGNGSNELIELAVRTFLRPGDEALISQGSFVAYGLALDAMGAEVRKVPLKDYGYDLEAMARALTPSTRLVFLANPNNPTGTIYRRPEWEDFLERVGPEVLVVADEAYFEYATDPDYPDSLDGRREDRTVLTIRTFSKVYGLAGLPRWIRHRPTRGRGDDEPGERTLQRQPRGSMGGDRGGGRHRAHSAGAWISTARGWPS